MQVLDARRSPNPRQAMLAIALCSSPMTMCGIVGAPSSSSSPARQPQRSSWCFLVLFASVTNLWSVDICRFSLGILLLSELLRSITSYISLLTHQLALCLPRVRSRTKPSCYLLSICVRLAWFPLSSGFWSGFGGQLHWSKWANHCATATPIEIIVTQNSIATMLQMPHY